MPRVSSKGIRGFVPRTTVSPIPLQHLRMPPCSSASARIFVPGAVDSSTPLQYLQMSHVTMLQGQPLALHHFGTSRCPLQQPRHTYLRPKDTRQPITTATRLIYLQVPLPSSRAARTLLPVISYTPGLLKNFQLPPSATLTHILEYQGHPQALPHAKRDVDCNV